MTYPPQLPTVLFSALNSVERSPDRRLRRASGTQTSHAGHSQRNPESTTHLGRGRHYLRRIVKYEGNVSPPEMTRSS